MMHRIFLSSVYSLEQNWNLICPGISSSTFLIKKIYNFVCKPSTQYLIESKILNKVSFYPKVLILRLQKFN